MASNSNMSSAGPIYGDMNFLLPSHNMNYGRYFVENITKFGDKIALMDIFNPCVTFRLNFHIDGITYETITYSEMARRIVNTAVALARVGIGRGYVLGICSENRVELFIAAIASMSIGASVTYLNPDYSRDEMAHTINLSKPKCIFISPSAHKTHFNLLNMLRVIRKFIIFGNNSPHKRIMTLEDFSKTQTEMGQYQPLDFFGKPETAIILYSSGTTGLPKAAKLTHLNLIVSAQQPHVTEKDIRILSTAPWCSAMGQVTTLRSMIKGQTFIFIPKFNETIFLQCIQKYKANLLITSPPVVVILSKSTILSNYDTGSVQSILSGGAPLDLDTINQIQNRIPSLRNLLNGYGMTELTGTVTEERETDKKLGSIGRIIPGIVIKIVDIKTRKLLGANQPGELCSKGLTLFDGYIELDEDGYYKTGDVAYYDEARFFYIVDRLKELIKYKSWQVSPSELEAVLLQHPAIQDVGVVGKPDKKSGELPTAFVVIKAGATATEKEIQDFVADIVSPWKKLRGGVKFIDKIPKNGSGKILRRK